MGFGLEQTAYFTRLTPNGRFHIYSTSAQNTSITSENTTVSLLTVLEVLWTGMYSLTTKWPYWRRLTVCIDKFAWADPPTPFQPTSNGGRMCKCICQSLQSKLSININRVIYNKMATDERETTSIPSNSFHIFTQIIFSTPTTISSVISQCGY